MRARAWAWVGPLLAMIAVAGIGTWLDRALAEALREDLRTQLEALRDTGVVALEAWMEGRGALATSIAEDPGIVALTADLRRGAPAERALAVAHIRERLAEEMRHLALSGFLILGPDGRPLAASADRLVEADPSPARAWLDRARGGETVISSPFPVAGVGAVMIAAAPLRDPAGLSPAILVLLLPVEAFTAVLRTARVGASGETYAFNSQGLLLSHSRFDDDLRAAGLLPGGAADAVLGLEIRDPGVNVVKDSSARRDPSPPLTRMALSAVRGETGVDVDGYPDYRGVPVAGAWTWLARRGIGIATELDLAEAQRTSLLVRNGFRAIVGLLLATAAAGALAGASRRHWRRRAEEGAVLGPYEIERPLGEGGMGKVYLARHALLQRPTAVKVLRADRLSPEMLSRFENEVRLTAGLTHPNTIAVYDFGRDADESFYYAMEYVDGLTLGRLVDLSGPLPCGRVISILAQAAGSLAEAHGLGLAHRDIKPSNIMLAARGGLHDVVKVLDFGLARAPARGGIHGSAGSSLVGTPLFLSPELILDGAAAGPSSDIYQLGAVGYFLLTGSAPFHGTSLEEICALHLEAHVELPDQRLGRAVTRDLADLLLACLAKAPADRPPTAAALAEALRACADAGTWTEEDARRWWETLAGDVPPQAASLSAAPPAAERSDVAEQRRS